MVETYLHDLTEVLRQQLGPELIGVYLFGSAALGAYEHGLSDLDVQAVARADLPLATRQGLAARLSQRALPCPAPRLEFVLYPQSAVRPMSARPAFNLNLNTGPTLEVDHVTCDLSEESPHWFVLDIAQGRSFGQALFGPPPGEVFSEVSRRLVLDALTVSMSWHDEHDRRSPNRVLNAARAWRYIETGQWGSKRAGLDWAEDQRTGFTVLEQAWQAREARASLPADEAATFLDHVQDRLSAAFNAISS